VGKQHLICYDNKHAKQKGRSGGLVMQALLNTIQAQVKGMHAC
jgi:hypothetical protein